MEAILTSDQLSAIKEFNRNIRWLKDQAREKQQKKIWVKAADILQATGWDKEKLRRMRDSGLIEFKKEGGWFYNPDSVPKIFFKS